MKKVLVAMLATMVATSFLFANGTAEKAASPDAPIEFKVVGNNSSSLVTEAAKKIAADIETNITRVLEDNLNTVSNLKKLTSKSQDNVSMITVEFEYGSDLNEGANEIRDVVSRVQSQLPDDIDYPTIFKFSTSMIPVMMLAVTAEESYPALNKILDNKLVNVLNRVDGVGAVSIIGAPEREVQVNVDPAKLEAYNLTVEQLGQIIAAENVNIPSGTIDVGNNTFNIKADGEFKLSDELRKVVVSNAGGRTVRLSDVAQIRDTLEKSTMDERVNGQRGVRVMFQKQSGANTVNVIRGVKKRLAEIEETLPSDIEITTVYDGSTEIIDSINTLVETIITTFIIVILVVFVFLGNWKSTIIIILSIPFALLASLIYLFATGNTLNIISMSALSIAIGMVVDDSIVVLENVSTHMARGEKPKEAAVHGTSEVGISVIASTLTMLCVFLPLTMIDGMAGIMFQQLGWIVSIIMIISTAAALTFVPMLCSRWLKADVHHGKAYNMLFNPINRFLDWISRGYAHVIHWATKRRKTVIFTFVGVFVVSMVIFIPRLTTEYFPHSDSDRISATIELPMGTAQDVTREFAARMNDDIVAAVPEAEIINYTFGQADTDNTFASMQDNGTQLISFTINIGSSGDRERTSAEIADVVRNVAAQYPEIRRATVTEGGGGMGGASTVDVEVYGYSFDETDRIARELQSKMLESPMYTQVTLSRDEYTPELQMDFDRTKLALNGLNSMTAGAAFSAAMSGSMDSYYREDGEEYDIRVRYSPEYRTRIEDLENILVTNGYGQQVRMKDLGTVVETLVPPTIERKDRERLVTVSGIVADGAALSEAVEAAQRAIDSTEIPTDLSVVVAGDYEDQQDMFGDLLVLVVLMIILVYMVMASQFEALMAPFVIMFSLPFALVGVFLGLELSGEALGVMALIGIIMLIGIVVKNGIVLIDYTILCRERGMNIRDASTTAARSRLRPILMTTLTTVLGMLPLAISQGEGAEMWRPLGITVCWGLTISTLITLVLIPTLYCSLSYRMERRKKK